MWADVEFLGAFAKLRKTTVTSVMSVRMEQIASHGTDVDETCYLIFVRIVVGKIQVLLKSDKNNGYFT